MKAIDAKAGAVVLAAVSAGLVLSGCASDNTRTVRAPTCEEGAASNAVILMAQSVPSAAWVPCLRTSLPGGWSFGELDSRNGLSRFWLASDRDGPEAIQVRLEKSCDTEGTTEIPSDREGMRRFERVTQADPEYRGERYYLFDGGCIHFVFILKGASGQTRGEPLALATQAVGAVRRTDLAAQVREKSNGRLHLDPPEENR